VGAPVDCNEERRRIPHPGTDITQPLGATARVYRTHLQPEHPAQRLHHFSAEGIIGDYFEPIERRTQAESF
jgi:hypothetical protein